jgi:thiol-disulfide isomerase/thioredoxin
MFLNLKKVFSCFFFIVPLCLLACSKTKSEDGYAMVYTLDNEKIDAFSSLSSKKATVFVFTAIECPISNRYAPALNQLMSKYTKDKISFFLVYTDKGATSKAIARHLKEYQFNCSALRDLDFELAKFSGVQVTPEVAVYSTDGYLTYRGRIDNRYVDFGKSRPLPTVHYLDAALSALVSDTMPKIVRTTAVGCYIPFIKSTVQEEF